jgi:aspartyl-tRNA(Asn)/glutamyl-tRNA(Gln) amidotransferase subunit A
VADCALLDQVLAADIDGLPSPAQLRSLRFAVPKTVFQSDLSPAVANAFTAALGRLSAAGAKVSDLPMAEFAQAADVNPRGALFNAEAYWWHRQWMKDGADKYDPRVIAWIRAGETVNAATYIDIIKLREQFIRTTSAAAAPYDAMLMPTIQETAPTIAEAGKDDDTYISLNRRMLRNTGVVNLFDGCALSIPCHEPGTAPVGMMIAGTQGTDRKILAIGLAVEDVIRRAHA